MSKFYAVQLTVTAIVQVADDGDELFAEKWALDHKRDIVSDNPMGVTTLCEVHSQADLRPFGWDGECLPYGGDGNTRLQDLLPKDARGGTPDCGCADQTDCTGACISPRGVQGLDGQALSCETLMDSVSRIPASSALDSGASPVSEGAEHKEKSE